MSRAGCVPTVSEGRLNSALASHVQAAHAITFLMLLRVTKGGLAPFSGCRQGAFMFAVNETEAASIRTVFHQDGELSAAVELRRLFPGIDDMAKARQMARVIAGWTPRPNIPATVLKFPRAKRKPTAL